MADGEDDEWEYEYDENETEDFYIPIDLSNVPKAQVPMNLERRLGHPTMLNSRLRALNAARGQLPEMPETATTDDGNATQEAATMGEVQITGLHTANPLIMYNGQLLSCQWTSTIGTDMFFTKPGIDSGDSPQPLRSFPSVDLLSLGTAKLVARTGRLRPRDDVIDGEEDAQAAAAGAIETEMNTNASVAPSQIAGGKLPSLTTPQSTSTNFLARLNEAKAKRGETSRLVVARAPEGPRLVSEWVEPPVRSGSDDRSQVDGDISMGDT